jgi:hypothetical protein
VSIAPGPLGTITSAIPLGGLFTLIRFGAECYLGGSTVVLQNLCQKSLAGFMEPAGVTELMTLGPTSLRGRSHMQIDPGSLFPSGSLMITQNKNAVCPENAPNSDRFGEPK